VDTVDKAAAEVDEMAAEAVEDDAEEDEAHLRRRRKTATYLKSEHRLPHCLVEVVEEQHQCMPQTQSNDSTIGITVSRVDLMWKMDIHRQHAPAIGGKLDIRRDVPGRMYNSTSRPDTQHRSRDSTKISCLRGSDR
jgi:hypothetical protein